MTDEFDIEHIDFEDAQDIINWAVGTGANIFMMHEIVTQGYTSDKERIEDLREAIEYAIANMPSKMIIPSQTIAINVMKQAIEEEEAVAKLRDELKDL